MKNIYKSPTKSKSKHFEIMERLLETSNLHFSTNYPFTIIHLAWRRPNNEEPILTTLERRLVLVSHSSSCDMDWDH